ncbi:MAG TPA: ATP-binding protein [Thermosynechococcaceae cyanobacterium]
MTNAPIPPLWIEGSAQALHLESVLEELPRYQFAIELECLGSDLAQIFEQHPILAGAVLTKQGQFVGMMSRQRLLEFLLRPQGLELFLSQPLRVLYSYGRCEVLQLSSHTPILAAAQQALRRSPELLGEPIIVHQGTHYDVLDVHALTIAYWQIRGIETQVRYERTQAQMIQSDKMANLGRLVDGVAHEILDPVSFIWGNLSHVTAYSESLLSLLDAYRLALPQPPPQIVHLSAALETDYLQQDLPKAIASIRAGAERLSKLATSLQNFCHIDEVYPKPADLHELLDSILLLLKSRLSSEIRVIRNYGHLPPVLCFAGQLNQVFMNVLSNSVDSLIDQAVSQHLDFSFNPSKRNASSTEAFVPTIVLTTQVRSLHHSSEETRWVSICITDNGSKLSPEIQKQLLESFTVERRALKETSLAVSYQIVTAKHGGKFEIRRPSALQGATLPADVGTEFEILLPIV